MKKTTICMFLLKEIRYDARVQKEAKTLAKNGHKVLIFYIKKDNANFLYPGVTLVPFGKAQVKHKNLSPKSRFLYSLKKPFRLVKNLLAYKRYLDFVIKWLLENGYKSDLAFHCHDLPALPIGLCCSAKFGGKVVYDSHELYPEMTGRGSLEKIIYTLIESNLIKRADIVISANEPRAEIMSKKYKISLPVVIKNYPDEEQSNNANIKLRNQLGIEKETVIIIYIGGLQGGRALTNLVEAMNFIESGAVLLLIGYGNLTTALKEKVEVEGLTERVIIMPPINPSEIHGYLKQADLGVAFYENISLNNWLAAPNKMYDYIMADTPVLVGNQPGISEEVAQYNVGLICETLEPNAIAKTITKYITNEGLIQKLKSNCKDNKQLFLWSTQEQKLLNIYSHLERGLLSCKKFA
ncbi:glycosyltransferase family 4 protein [Peptococcaceae bacterium 1198_IL3148]